MPASPMRSGGPGSLVPWDSVGADGKTFLASGPNAGPGQRGHPRRRGQGADPAVRERRQGPQPRGHQEPRHGRDGPDQGVGAQLDPRHHLDEHRLRQRVGGRVVRVPPARRLGDRRHAVLHAAVGARPAHGPRRAAQGRPAAVQGGRRQDRVAAPGPAAQAVRRWRVPRRLRRERGVRLARGHAGAGRRRAVDGDAVVHADSTRSLTDQRAFGCTSAQPDHRQRCALPVRQQRGGADRRPVRPLAGPRGTRPESSTSSTTPTRSSGGRPTSSSTPRGGSTRPGSRARRWTTCPGCRS